jgi:amino acid permease
MNKRLAYALLLIGVLVLILVLNGRGYAEVEFGFASVRGLRAIVYLAFSAAGVIIGSLLK